MNFPSARPSRAVLACFDLVGASYDDAPLDLSAARALGHAAQLLAHARRLGWDVVHVLTARDRPVQGGDRFAPTQAEPVFYGLRASAWSSAAFRTFMRERPDAELLIVGRSDASICLATALTAYDRGVATALVDDAILAAAHERQGFGALVDLTRRSGRRGVRIEAAERLLRLRPAFRVVQGGLAHSATG